MFKRSAKALREFALRLLYPSNGAKGADLSVIDPLLLKARIPRSWFTKTGPGVTANAHRAFETFTREQQVFAVKRGWFPESWLYNAKELYS